MWIETFGAFSTHSAGCGSGWPIRRCGPRPNATVAFGHRPSRLLTAEKNAAAQAANANQTFPKVSIHVPAYFEPPEMLKQTLDAVARLDYPNFECVVIINNTPDPAFWQPIQDHCRTLGERFKFINAEKVKGFKAGALRIAMVPSCE